MLSWVRRRSNATASQTQTRDALSTLLWPEYDQANARANLRRTLSALKRGLADQGDRHHEAALHNNLADLLYAEGRSEEAMVHLKQAVPISAEVGSAADPTQPEIWKLTEW